MADRTIALYEEPRNPEGPHWTMKVERSASGRPALFFTIKTQMHDPAHHYIESLNREMTILIEDADVLLGPAIEWLKKRRTAQPDEVSETNSEGKTDAIL